MNLVNTDFRHYEKIGDTFSTIIFLSTDLKSIIMNKYFRISLERTRSLQFTNADLIFFMFLHNYNILFFSFLSCDILPHIFSGIMVEWIEFILMYYSFCPFPLLFIARIRIIKFI